MLAAMGAEIIPGDLTAVELPALPEGLDIVFHAAGIIHPARIRDLYALNTEGTRRLLTACAKAGARRFVYVSSNSPAGVNRDRRQLLDESELAPYKHYGISKLLAETAVLAATAAGMIEGVVIRPCWFYGPGQPARQTRFFKMIAGGRPVIFGAGWNLRSMSYIDNVVQGLVLAALSPRSTGRIYWIADARPYSINEIYATIASVLGIRDFRPRHVPELISRLCGSIDDALQACGLYAQEFHVAGELSKDIACSIDKARRELNYSPTVELKEGLRRSVEWCRQVGQLPAVEALPE